MRQMESERGNGFRMDQTSGPDSGMLTAPAREIGPNTPELPALKPFPAVSLGDKYDLGHNRIFVSGTQAIVRLLLMQKDRDRQAGRNTAGYVTGYRGSPLGGIDQQLARIQPLLDQNDIVFRPGLNEDLAATAVWGTQQAEMRGEGKYDGVFATGTPKVRVSIVRATFSVMPISQVPRSSAASLRSWATITPRNPRPRRTRASFISLM